MHRAQEERRGSVTPVSNHRVRRQNSSDYNRAGELRRRGQREGRKTALRGVPWTAIGNLERKDRVKTKVRAAGTHPRGPMKKNDPGNEGKRTRKRGVRLAKGGSGDRRPPSREKTQRSEEDGLWARRRPKGLTRWNVLASQKVPACQKKRVIVASRGWGVPHDDATVAATMQYLRGGDIQPPQKEKKKGA